ncbi:MAG: hypothetical protein J4478_01210 [Candidatus Diapherotrites archaeon]|uniref:Uncharacterized protein n=1 Tax=Candidatus Iainarchaeum sp. TaxID=3101447 RepID=A0A7J4K232_9ARCH|nr:hypothetical protein [Candidatus Diapherotrites archaeon]HIH21576.1 hypothetical protein [Candidatus Diapherotrites archaeon]HIH33271.1 hypothetical protein [Candidatus Diapherotrites archaeon]
MNSIVFDSSSIISISEKCFIKVLEKLSQKAELAIPKKVEFESITRPSHIKAFELNALRIQTALSQGWIKSIQLEPEFLQLSLRVKETANSCFFINNRPFVLIQDGEAETLALLRQLGASTLVIDERNTRMLIEDIQGLHSYLQARIAGIMKNEQKIAELKKMLSGIKVCRSSELIAWAFEKGILESELQKNKESLEAALYAVKYSGCAVSEREINDYLGNF